MQFLFGNGYNYCFWFWWTIQSDYWKLDILDPQSSKTLNYWNIVKCLYLVQLYKHRAQSRNSNCQYALVRTRRLSIFDALGLSHQKRTFYCWKSRSRTNKLACRKEKKMPIWWIHRPYWPRRPVCYLYMCLLPRHVFLKCNSRKFV